MSNIVLDANDQTGSWTGDEIVPRLGDLSRRAVLV